MQNGGVCQFLPFSAEPVNQLVCGRAIAKRGVSDRVEGRFDLIVPNYDDDGTKKEYYNSYYCVLE